MSNVVKLESVTEIIRAAQWYLAEGEIEMAERLLESLAICIEHGRLN